MPPLPHHDVSLCVCMVVTIMVAATSTTTVYCGCAVSVVWCGVWVWVWYGCECGIVWCVVVWVWYGYGCGTGVTWVWYERGVLCGWVCVGRCSHPIAPSSSLCSFVTLTVCIVSGATTTCVRNIVTVTTVYTMTSALPPSHHRVCVCVSFVIAQGCGVHCSEKMNDRMV